jgi:hypothetical protein
MPGVDLGTDAPVRWDLGDSGQTVTLAVIRPDGTSLSPAVTSDDTAYTATVPTPQPGRYLLRWTKVAAPARTFTDTVDVWPADPRFLLSLPTVRGLCGADTDDTTADDTLRLLNAATTVIIEDIAGAILSRTIVQRADGGKSGINLWERPSEDDDVTVSVDGTELTIDVGFVVNYNAAIVYAGPANAPTYFQRGRQNVVVAYTAGGTVTPPNIILAAGELVRHLYEIGHEAAHSNWANSGDERDDMTETPSGFLVPRRVVQLCESGDTRLPGIA